MRPIQKKGARVNSRNKKGTPAQILEIFEKKNKGTLWTMYYPKFENLDAMCKFLEKHNSPNWHKRKEKNEISFVTNNKY